MSRNEAKTAYDSKQSEGKEAAEAAFVTSDPSQESVPYEILEGDGHNMYIAVFTVPLGLETQIASRYINARGAQFVLELDSQPGKVRSTFYSSDPRATADAIGVRLTQRIQDPSPPGAEECSIM
jgi:hypothetical protein